MDEYIKREATIERLKKNLYASNPGSFSYLCYQDAINSVQEIPPADVVPMRHGRWIEPTRLYYGAKQYECSLCHSDTFWKKHSITEKYPCCPNCGAKMDLEQFGKDELFKESKGENENERF